MPSAERSFRGVFDAVAELYDKARPGYPSQVFDDIAELADLTPSSRVLEIGCGSGQATVALAAAGYDIVAVELGERLAAIARRKLQGFPKVRVDVDAFEDWPLRDQRFDLVACATAFHWIDPDVRMQKVARALRPGGSIALIDTEHVAGGTNDFYDAVQECYRRWDPTTSAEFHMPTVDDIPRDSKVIDECGLFGPVTLRRYVREIPYSADEYVDVLATYSAQRHLPDADRQSLYDDIRRLIVEKFDDRIVKTYLTELRVARALESPSS
jgi:SAM-dependent methyltransferase